MCVYVLSVGKQSLPVVVAVPGVSLLVAADNICVFAAAVSCDHRDVVRLLMAHNADVTVADEDGCTPLDDASYDMKDLLTAGMSSGCVLAI